MSAGRTIQILGILSALTLGSFLLMILRDPDQPFLGALLAILIMQVLIIYLGHAVKQHRLRTAAITYGAFLLAVFPVGTILGLYIIWNLAKKWDETSAQATREP